MAQKAQVRVIVDSRERNAELAEALKNDGVSVSTETLQVGDYAISDRVCIERKTVQDFESSLMNTRLFEQAGRLREHYDSPIVLIEGEGSQFRLDRNVITGAIAHLYIDLGVQVMLSDSARDTARIIAALARHEQGDGAREPSMKGSARAYSDRDYQEYVIGNLPGVGPKIARGLLEHFGSVSSVADAGIEELMLVDRVGRRKAERIFSIMNDAYRPD